MLHFVKLAADLMPNPETEGNSQEIQVYTMHLIAINYQLCGIRHQQFSRNRKRLKNEHFALIVFILVCIYTCILFIIENKQIYTTIKSQFIIIYLGMWTIKLSIDAKVRVRLYI